jgi:hypothetical protein
MEKEPVDNFLKQVEVLLAMLRAEEFRLEKSVDRLRMHHTGEQERLFSGGTRKKMHPRSADS